VCLANSSYLREWFALPLAGDEPFDFRVVVGVAACRHSGGVSTPHGFFFVRGRKNKTIHIKHNHALCTRLA